MDGREILEQALKLRPEERFVVQGLLRSLNEVKEEVDKLWIEEVEKRLQAYRAGLLECVPMEKILF